MLTIISVSYKSKALLDMNYRLVKALNPNTPFHWIVVQNTPPSDLENDLAMDDPRFEMIRGAVTPESEKESIFQGASHHAKALNLAFSYTTADLILVLDPDCYFLMPNWIERITEHIKKEKIAFFGTPYHPQAHTHFQGFPCGIGMFINRRLLHEQDCFCLDFSPYMDRKRYKTPMLRAIHQHCSYKRLLYFFFKAKRHPALKFRDLPLILREGFERNLPQLFIGCLPDTGYQIYKRYRSRVRYEALQVYARDERTLATKLFESILPNTIRTYPRHAPWITTNSAPMFKEFENDGYQFFWQGQLFAYHIQGTRYPDTKEQLRVQAQLFNKLEEFLSCYEHTNKVSSSKKGEESCRSY